MKLHVCSKPGCAVLVSKDEPCPTHGRPKNASWSKDRDHKAHWRLRMAVIKARGTQCERCGWQSPTPQGQGLQIHHVKPGNTPDCVIVTCRNCHKEIDPYAR